MGANATIEDEESLHAEVSGFEEGRLETVQPRQASNELQDSHNLISEEGVPTAGAISDELPLPATEDNPECAWEIEKAKAAKTFKKITEAKKEVVASSAPLRRSNRTDKGAVNHI